MTQQARRLPVGLQSFEKIRREGYVYVDKTDLVWELIHGDSQYNYLSRPRRFGKSILVDTLACYFSGKKELFEGLKIMNLEEEWTARPVVRLDMSCGGSTANELRAYLSDAFGKYEKQYGITPEPSASLTTRFSNIIAGAHEQTGQQVAVLIDEYDFPLQHSWNTNHHEECTNIYRSVFAMLKTNDIHERFVFITGVTKFTQISLFSALNNLSNISFSPRCASICGITEEEISIYFQPEVKRLADYNGWTAEEARQRLKDFYDGYHFSARNTTDVYNPFSLINALSRGELQNYWASSGATSMIPKFVDNLEIRLSDFDPCMLPSHIAETSDVTSGGAALFLFQSGYLTIKDYQMGVYTLGFPNREVRQALNEIVLPSLAMRRNGEIQSLQANLFIALQLGKVAEAMKSLKALIADVPYSNKKLASMDMEERYRLVISTILNAIGLQVEVEHMLANGRIDIVAQSTRYAYVIELKLKGNGGIIAAKRQIQEHNYLAPFQGDKRKAIGLAIELDDLGKGLTDWQIVE